MAMHFVVVTADYGGLGFAIRLKDEGHTVVLATNPKLEDRSNPERWATCERVGRVRDDGPAGHAAGCLLDLGLQPQPGMRTTCFEASASAFSRGPFRWGAGL